MLINSKAFSLIELLIVITIIGLLTAIAIPSYKTYITKAKMVEIFTLADIHKLQLTEKIINGDTTNINKIIKNPNKLIEQLEYINLNDTQYVLKFTANMLKLGISPINNKALTITFTGEENTDNQLITWHCQYTSGFKSFVPNVCTEIT